MRWLLIQRIVQNGLGNGRNLLREGEALEWFEKWSTMARKFPEFLPSLRGDNESIPRKNAVAAEAQSDFEQLEKVRLIGDDFKMVDKVILLENILLWQLLRIPFSAEVAQSVPKLDLRSLSGKPGEYQSGEQGLVSGEMPLIIRGRIANALKKPVLHLSHSDFSELKELDLSASEVSDADMVYLAALKNLKAINLKATRIRSHLINA